jgi:serine protease Do
MKHWLLALGFGSAVLLSSWAPATGADDPRETPIVRAIRRAAPSVINIHTEKTAVERDSVFNANPAKARKVNGMGTGVVLDERGYIVTNFHVVAEVDVIRAVLQDGSDYQATVVRYDREHDLAVIKIDANKPLQVMPHGTSSDLMLGETVIAVGNAYGYRHTSTEGIISALSRDVEANETQSYKNLIQTDASINPGNSGGPLLNINGDVIGINVAIRAGAQRIGFAIPIDDVRKIVAQLMSVEQLDRNYHGLGARDVKAGATRKLVVDNAQPDSPAAKAGLKTGDVVLKVGEREIVDNVDWERSLLGKNVGEPVTVTVRRGDKTETMQLALAPLQTGRTRLPNDPYIARANNDTTDADRFWRLLGVRLGGVPQDRTGSIPSKYRGGLLVTEVRPQSPAFANGIRKDDILVGLWGFETLSYENIHWILNQPTPTGKDAQQYFVIRGQQTLFGSIQPVADAKATTTK